MFYIGKRGRYSRPDPFVPGFFEDRHARGVERILFRVRVDVVEPRLLGFAGEVIDRGVVAFARLAAQCASAGDPLAVMGAAGLLVARDLGAGEVLDGDEDVPVFVLLGGLALGRLRRVALLLTPGALDVAVGALELVLEAALDGEELAGVFFLLRLFDGEVHR